MESMIGIGLSPRLSRLSEIQRVYSSDLGTEEEVTDSASVGVPQVGWYNSSLDIWFIHVE